VRQPALYISGDKDPVGTFAPVDPMKASVPHLKIVAVPDCGHWTQQEEPERVNTELIEFLRSL
jgi:pimeloyl-ACP methyl ester carboxylesterase